MKLLLDTHVFLWLRFESKKVSEKVLEAYESDENQVYLSLVSVWEIQLKQQLGKLEIDTPLNQLIQQQREQNDLKILSIELEHIFGIGELPFHHKDPFDRLLISQTKHEDAVLASSDEYFDQYDVKLLW